MPNFLHALWDIAVELAPWLFLGALAAGLLHVTLPAGWLHTQLRGRLGVIKAVLFGVPLPLCSCGVIPTGLGLKRDGASDGAAVAFLVATPQTGVDAILVSAAFLGWPFALFKVGAAVVTGTAAGLLVDAHTRRHPATSTTPSSTCTTGCDAHSHAGHGCSADPLLASGWQAPPAWRRALDHADELIRSIWRWLALGIVVSAAITALVPPQALASTAAGGPFVAALAVLAISVPMYVCATASVPIAAGLLHAGMPPSAALVFLLAGPAVNIATLGAVRAGFGPGVHRIYLATLIVGSLVLGLLFDAVLPTDLPSLIHDEAHGWPAHVAAAGLALLFLRYAIEEVRRARQKRRPPTSASFQVQGPARVSLLQPPPAPRTHSE